MRVTVEADSGIATLINVFTVTAERQAAVVESLRAFTEKHARRLPGFIAAAVHRSVDGTQVVNYAQWSTPDAMNEMLASPAAIAHLREVRELAQAIQPHLYQVAYVGSREGVP
jgi:heme-degrading monooxygenase HmoA